jgi:hypothetical protein
MEPAMTAANCLLYLLAGAVLVAVVMRLAALRCAGKSLRCRVTWNLWVFGQVDIAVGAVAVLIGRPYVALGFLLMGLTLQYAVRIHRGSTHRC